uniref:Uncharacterized protein n=1 Tax=Graphocephala atropunctata TaxID=36148 RepID=A0A1B6MD66_9HEMI
MVVIMEDLLDPPVHPDHHAHLLVDPHHLAHLHLDPHHPAHPHQAHQVVMAIITTTLLDHPQVDPHHPAHHPPAHPLLQDHPQLETQQLLKKVLLNDLKRTDTIFHYSKCRKINQK